MTRADKLAALLHGLIMSARENGDPDLPLLDDIADVSVSYDDNETGISGVVLKMRDGTDVTIAIADEAAA